MARRRDLELHRALALVLQYHRAGCHLVAVADVADHEAHEVTAAQLAVDPQMTAITAALWMLPTALGLGEGAAPEQGRPVVIVDVVIWSALRSTNLIPALNLHW